ncbi:conserved hypothetical protein [Sphingomonas sp. 8AM]|nr:conserved hypothetical protein [Sphingomonas sp. 8AM]
MDKIVAATRRIAALIGGGLLAVAVAAVPALGAADSAQRPVRKLVSAPRVAGSFTPSAADPKLAALFARGGLDASGFRFTPSESRIGNRAVTVAVRARSSLAARDNARYAATTPATVGLAPIAYNLGVSVGWKRFAVSGDVAKVDLAGLPGSREAADVAVSYSGSKWSGRVGATADRPLPGTARALSEPDSYSIDVGGSYSLTRNLDLTAGMRLKTDRERLTRADDDRRDSQAIYVGTAFRF